MTTSTRSGLGPTLLVIAVLAAAVALVTRGGSEGEGDPQDLPATGSACAEDDLHECLVLSVLFKPNRRIDDPVHVQAHVEEVQVENTLVTHSPYNGVLRIPRGAQVSLYTWQDSDGELDCLVSNASGGTIDTNHRDSQGSVRCWHNRKN